MEMFVAQVFTDSADWADLGEADRYLEDAVDRIAQAARYRRNGLEDVFRVLRRGRGPERVEITPMTGAEAVEWMA